MIAGMAESTHSSASPIPANWKGVPLTVLGLSKSGAAVARYVAKRGGQVFLSEMLPTTPASISLQEELIHRGVQLETGGHTQRCYTHAPWVVVSPGIPPTSPVMQQLKLSGIPIISEVELAFRESQERPLHNPQFLPIPWIGITGTNGKTTTTTLVSRMLSDSGLTAPACGNIGLPIMDLLDEIEPGEGQPERSLDFIVAELSSFQLAFSPTLKPFVAALLNITPDHIAWHGSLDGYKIAKTTFLMGSRSPEWVVLNAEDSVCREVAVSTQARIGWFTRIPESVEVLKQQPHAALIAVEKATGELVIEHKADNNLWRTYSLGHRSVLKIPGNHNVENVLAASAIAYLAGVSPESINNTLNHFEGVEHRIEWCGRWQRSLDNRWVNVYNDSKATNVSASLAALNAFPGQPVVLVAGGRPKEEPLDPFVDACKNQVESVILYGEAAERFSQVLTLGNYRGPVHVVSTLAEALTVAKQQLDFMPSEALNRYAKPTEPILLFSPACASFDQFANFEVRGTMFKAILEGLLSHA
ncbi:MAG: UDP-N-acetylmuramoyl-L-alanine--D-glutamate ligase [Vampirovibrionales bacterium]